MLDRQDHQALEIQRLRDRVEELEELLGLRADVIRPPGLSRTEWRLLGALSSGRVCSRDFLLRTLYPGPEYPEDRTVDVFVGRVRNWLRKHRVAVRILTQRSDGYFVEPRDLSKLREVLENANGQFNFGDHKGYSRNYKGKVSQEEQQDG